MLRREIQTSVRGALEGKSEEATEITANPISRADTLISACRVFVGETRLRDDPSPKS